MSISLSGEELIKIAIDIERRGTAFYDIMSKSTENATARIAFQYLADMERGHVQIFENMLGKVDKHQPSENNAEEKAAYLQALFDSAAFTDEMVESEMATQANSDIEALELAIAAEKDSILFYYELRDIMPKRVHTTVNRIIAEEKLHLRQLTETKKELTNP